MITVWNTPIAASVEQILRDLRLELISEGLLRDQVNTGSDVMVTCPFHKGGHERKPSCGVSLKEKITPGKTYEAGTVHCYTCGYVGDLPTFISDLFGMGNPMDGFRWLVGQYNYSSSQREELSFDFYRGADEKPVGMDTAQVDEYHTALMSNQRAKDYLRGRGIIPDVMEIFKLGYSREDDQVLFPVYSRSGEVLFYKGRSLRGKHFYNSKDVDKTTAVYGLYQTLREEIPEDTEIWITESEIDALSLISRGVMAWALMGSDLSDIQAREILRTPYRRFVIATDNDPAGRKGARMIKDKLIPCGCRFYNLRWLTGEKDVNELIQAYGDEWIAHLNRY